MRSCDFFRIFPITKHNKIGPTGSMPCSAQDGLNLCGSLRVGKFLKLFVQCLAEVIAKKCQKGTGSFCFRPTKEPPFGFEKTTKSLGKGTVPTAANARREFQGLKTLKALGSDGGAEIQGRFPSFFLLTPQKYTDISSSVMYTVPGVVH